MTQKSLYHPETTSVNSPSASDSSKKSNSIVKSLGSRHKSPTPLASVTKFEVVRQLKKPSFWIALLLMPVFIIAIVAFSAFTGYSAGSALNNTDYSDRIIGIVDDASILAESSTAGENSDISTVTDSATMNENSDPESANNPTTDSAENDSTPATPTYHLYPTQAEALQSLHSGEIDLLYHLPADFLATATAQSYQLASYTTLLDASDQPLRALLLAQASAEVSPADLLILTNNYAVSSTTIDESGAEVNLLGQAIIPLAILIIFYVMVCVFGNRLLMTVVEEKENRISEMILTSVSARHLIIGKLLALAVLGLVQIAVLVIPLVALLILYRDNPAIASTLSAIEWDPLAIAANLTLFLFSFFLFAGLSTLIGSLVPTAREASQYIGPVIIGIMLPLFFINTFFTPDPSATTYFLTYFPLSAPISLMLRTAFGTLPWWEFAIGLTELIILTVFVIHLTIKTFQKNAINFSVRRPTFAARKKWK